MLSSLSYYLSRKNRVAREPYMNANNYNFDLCNVFFSLAHGPLGSGWLEIESVLVVKRNI